MSNTRVFKLKNGLKLVFYQDKSKHVTLASLFVKFGGKNRKVKIDNNVYDISSGTAHFLEHLLIEHSHIGNALLKFKDKHTFSNGYTTKDNTEFYINSVDNFEDDLVNLIKMVNCPCFDEESVLETKKAVIKEKMMSNDNKFNDFSKLEYECLFENINFPNILGEVEDIESLSYEKVKFCYDLFYQPSNQVLIISGNFNMNKIKKLVIDTYENIERDNIEFSNFSLEEKNEVVKEEGYVEKDVHTDFVNISYKVNISKYHCKDAIKLEYYLYYFLSYLFDGKSLIYNKLIDDKISLCNINYSVVFEDNFIIVKIATSTNNHLEFINRIVSAMEKKELNLEDFLLRKKQSIIDIVLREDTLSDTIIPFISNIIKFDYDYMDKISDVEEQSFDDYKKVIESLDFSNYVVTKMIRKKIAE